MNDAELVKGARELLGWSRARMAVEVGKAGITVRGYESGKFAPPPEVVRHLLVAMVSRGLKDRARAAHIAKLAGR